MSADADRPGDLDVGRRRDHGDVAALGHVDPHRDAVAPEEAHARDAAGPSPPRRGRSPDGRHSTVARSTSSSAAGVSASSETTVASVVPSGDDHQPDLVLHVEAHGRPGVSNVFPCLFLLSGRAVAVQAVAPAAGRLRLLDVPRSSARTMKVFTETPSAAAPSSTRALRPSLRRRVMRADRSPSRRRPADVLVLDVGQVDVVAGDPDLDPAVGQLGRQLGRGVGQEVEDAAGRRAAEHGRRSARPPRPRRRRRAPRRATTSDRRPSTTSDIFMTSYDII